MREETFVKKVQKEPFTKKKPSSWMFEQMEEDFALAPPVASGVMDQDVPILAPLYPNVVRYRIVNNRLFRFVPDGQKLNRYDTEMEKAIKTLLVMKGLPDADFFLSYFDASPVSASKEYQSPIFVFAKMRGAKGAILIPDERSVGQWWLNEIKDIQNYQIEWKKKKRSALWRGGFTREVRKFLCRLSLKHPEILDARFSSSPVEKEVCRALEEEGLMGERRIWKDFVRYRYLPYVDGVMCATPALQARLYSQSVAFKPDSDEVQWFYRSLKKGVHFIGVKSDLSDLIEKIEWAKENDAACFEIAQNAYAFAKENLLFGDVYHYLYLLLSKYGQVQGEKGLAQKTKKDPHWICIQKRKGFFDYTFKASSGK